MDFSRSEQSEKENGVFINSVSIKVIYVQYEWLSITIWILILSGIRRETKQTTVTNITNRQPMCKKNSTVLTHWLPDLLETHVFNILKIFRQEWAKVAPIYSKSDLQHDSMPFFPLTSLFTVLVRRAQKSKSESDLRLKLFCSLFLLFLLQWLTFYWATFQFKMFWKSIIKRGNFYHGVATCSRRNYFTMGFHSNLWLFSSIFKAS